MKNRSKILSPRDTQIRRELSNSAEYAASGFSGIYSSAKNQLKRVISKLSGVYSTAIHLIFPNPEISVQERDLYSFNLKLESISDTIKNPLPGPKPLHLDSYTMPPTPGRFLTSEDSGNKKEKIIKHELRFEMKTKPEYGVPVWKQLGTYTGNRDKSVIQTNEKMKKTVEKPAPGSDGIRKVKENPNSTPIRIAEKLINKNTVFYNKTAGSDPDKKTPQFFENSDRFMRSDEREKENLERKNLDFKDDDGDSFSFMDKDDRNDIKYDKNVLVKLNLTETYAKTEECSSELEKKMNIQNCLNDKLITNKVDQQPKDEDQALKNVEVGKSVLAKTNSFFVPDSEKKLVEMGEGFINSKSTSKTSSPSKLSESEKSGSDPVKPNQNLKPDKDLKKNENNSNPFLKPTEQPDKSVYVFGSSSNPFVTRENTSTSFSNPFVTGQAKIHSKHENLFNNPEKPDQKIVFSSGKPNDSLIKNPFSSNISVKNPFSQSKKASGGIQSQVVPPLPLTPQVTNPFLMSQNLFSPMMPEAISSQPQSLSSDTMKSQESSNRIGANQLNNFETSLRNQKSSKISNPWALVSSIIDSKSADLKNFPVTSDKVKNPFMSNSKDEPENKANFDVLYTTSSRFDEEPKKTRDEGKAEGKIVNPFVLPDKKENSKSDLPQFVLGVMPSRNTSQVKRNNK